MDGMKRWKLKGFLPGVEGECRAVFQPTVVLEDDFDAALAREAALREELAEYQKILASYKNNYVTKLAYNAVQSSLTAAEQRNSELTGLLVSSVELIPMRHTRIRNSIDAALKPTESGASE